MKLPKYVRIQGREIAWKTKKPVGVFILNWRRIRDNIYSPEDVKLYDETHQWFLDNLPQPPFYGDNNDNPQGAITYFKTENCDVMLEKIQPLIDLLDKYDIPYDVVYTNYIGKIIYEDEYQGGSGAGCSSLVFNSYFYSKLKENKLKRILLISTGALLSSLSSQQGESIPGIAHAVVLEG